MTRDGSELYFAVKLSLEMGIPLREMLRRMGAREFLIYQVFYSIDPFGSARGDLQAGIVASAIGNTVPRKKGAAFRRWKPGDFILSFFRRRRARRQSVAEMAAMMKSLAQRHGTVISSGSRRTDRRGSHSPDRRVRQGD